MQEGLRGDKYSPPSDWKEFEVGPQKSSVHTHEWVPQDPSTSMSEIAKSGTVALKLSRCECGMSLLQRFRHGVLVKERVLPAVVRGKVHPDDREPRRYDSME